MQCLHLMCQGLHGKTESGFLSSVEGRGLDVEGRGFEAKGSGSQVEGSESQVEGRR